MDNDHSFTVTTDTAVISLIESTKRRFAVMAPALPRAFTDALEAQSDNLKHLDMRVIVDADAKVDHREGIKQVQEK